MIIYCSSFFAKVQNCLPYFVITLVKMVKQPPHGRVRYIGAKRSCISSVVSTETISPVDFGSDIGGDLELGSSFNDNSQWIV